MGIGYATIAHPTVSGLTFQSQTADRASASRLISGGTVGVLLYQVGTQSGNVDVGIYANTGSGESAAPSSSRFTLGTTPCPAAGTISVTVSPALQVTAGGDWFALAADNATATFGTTYSELFQTEMMRSWGVFRSSSFPLPASLLGGGVSYGMARPFVIVGQAT
jgi:hypothetical protein